MATNFTDGKFHADDKEGRPARNWRLYTTDATTTNQKTTYTDNGLTTPNTYVSDGAGGQYILLDAMGSAQVWWGTGAIRMRLFDPAGVLAWDVDNIPASSADTLRADLAASSDPTKGAALIGGLIANSVTLNVPASYATIQAALTYLADYTIARNATVTIQVADGTLPLTSSTLTNHPNGDRIRILGNEANPAACVLSVAGSGFDCIIVSNGYQLGYLNGFTLLKTVKALAADNSIALLADTGAVLTCGPNMKADNWYYGVQARFGGVANVPNIIVDHSGDVGVHAFAGGVVNAPNAVSNNASDVANNLGFGFQGEYGGVVNCEGASGTGCRIAAFGSLSNSIVRAPSANGSNNTGSGFFVRDGGVIEAHGAIANNNTRYGVEDIADGHVYFNSMTATGNALGNFSPKVYFDNGSLGARIVADDGPMRIDNSGANGFDFNSSGGDQFSIGHTASAVNRWKVTGSATGAGVNFDASGTDANISANVRAKANEVVRLYSNGNAAFQAYNSSASAVNYLQANGSATGSTVALAAAGADTNIAAAVRSKGAAVVSLDSNGNIAFQVNNVSASAVNFGQVDGSATGLSVDYKARGGDTNIDLGLSPRGSGVVKFGTYTAGGDTVSNGYITIKDSGGTTRKLMVTA